MLKYLLVINTFLFFLGDIYSQSQFQRTIGGVINDGSNSIARTADGGYVIAGETRSYGAGQTDIYVLKFDMNDSIQWSRTIGSTGNEGASSIVQTSDGGYAVAGYTFSYGAGFTDFFVVKLDINGTILWSKTIGGSDYEEAYSITETSDGGIAVAGYTSSFGVDEYDIYIVKLSNSGTMLWSKTIGGPEYEDAYSIIKTSEGGLAIAGDTDSFGSGQNDMLIVKLDNNGTIQWNKTIGGAANDYAESIVQSSDGGLLIAGPTITYSAGLYDFYIAKLDISGSLLWTKTIGGTGSDFAHCIIKTTDGGYAATGWTTSFGAGSTGDFYIVKLDVSGNIQWNKRAGGVNQDIPFSMIQTNAGDYIVTGYSGNGGIGTSYDIYTVKFDNTGLTCGNTSSPNPVLGAGGVLGSPVLMVNSPSSIVNSPSPIAGTGEVINNICLITGLSNNNNMIPEQFKLYQNYPNPFNPETVIKYDLSQNAMVTVIVYSATGSEVATLVSKEQSPGTYNVTWNGSSYPSGVYFFRMMLDAYTVTKKMLLIK